MVVSLGTPLVGRRVAELPLPADSLIVTISRDGQTLIPRGDTMLQAGDHLTILVREPGRLGSARDAGRSGADQT